MMTEHQDPDVFGHMLLDTAAEQETWEIIERDDGFVSARSAEVYFDDYNHWPAVEKTAIRLAKGKVLDIGCGAGKHALHLQQQGIEVLAVDSSRGAVIAARHRGVRNAMILPLQELPSNEGPFDTVLILGNSFSFLGPTTRLKATLAQLHELTSAGGMILATIRDPQATGIAQRSISGWHARSGYHWESRIRIRYRQLVSGWHDYLILDEARLRDILPGTGWELRDTLQDEGCYLAVLHKEELPEGVFPSAPPVTD